MRFIAVAIGPKGRYWAAKSEVFNSRFTDDPRDDHPNHVAILETFIKQLTSDGWEAVPGRAPMWTGGDMWFGYRFRRPVRN
jgi:hypothetical protein